MKKSFWMYTKHLLSAAILTTIGAVTTTSCEGIYDEEGDCDPHYYLRFVFDMNMEYADAFYSQVNSVDVWVFDNATDRLVEHISESGEALTRQGYLLPLHLQPGDYRFVAWCGLNNNEHFTVHGNIGNRPDTKVTMRRDNGENGAFSKSNLKDLFHGVTEGKLPTWSEMRQLMETFDASKYPMDIEGSTAKQYAPEYIWDEVNEQYKVIYTVSLIRDTNNITLTLQHLSGEFNVGHLSVTMTDTNGSLNHDNSIDHSDNAITYLPWHINTGILEQHAPVARAPWSDIPGYDIDDPENADDKYAGFLYTEHSTSRLMADHNPVITIYDHETNRTLFQIPVVKWALQMRSANYANMTDQEYLDREKDYNLMVFLQDDGRGGWMAVEIVINGWHKIDNGVDNQ